MSPTWEEGVMLTIIKVFIILFLLEVIEKILKINQQALLSVECLGIFSSCPDWRGEEGLFKGCKKGGCIMRLPPRALGCHKR